MREREIPIWLLHASHRSHSWMRQRTTAHKCRRRYRNNRHIRHPQLQGKQPASGQSFQGTARPSGQKSEGHMLETWLQSNQKISSNLWSHRTLHCSNNRKKSKTHIWAKHVAQDRDCCWLFQKGGKDSESLLKIHPLHPRTYSSVSGCCRDEPTQEHRTEKSQELEKPPAAKKKKETIYPRTG